MVACNFFNSAKENLVESINLGTDTLKLALSNTAPSATNTVLADITQITAGNGYTAGGASVTVTSSSQTSGTYSLVIGNVTFTASGGDIPASRYFILYSDTPTSPADPLICWWDQGTSTAITSGSTKTLSLTAVSGVAFTLT